MKGFIVAGISSGGRRLWLVFGLVTWLTSGSAVAADAAGCLADELGRLLTSPQIGKMRVGVRVVCLEDPRPRVVYDLNPDEPLKPASTQKILTTAAVFALLPADFKFRTVLARRGDDLVVIGSGDPAIGDPQLARAARESITAVFHRWADKLKAAGVTRATGDLLLDDYIFEQRFINASWTTQFKDQMERWYCAPVGGLNFNDNCVDIVVRPGGGVGSPAQVTLIPTTPYVKLANTCKTAAKGEPAIRRTVGETVTVSVSGSVSRPGSSSSPLSLTVGDPGLFFASTLRTVLAAEGIAIDGATRRARVRLADNSIPRDLEIVAVHEQTLPDVIQRCNKNSQNMFAETLLKTVGAYAGTTTDRPRIGSYETGRQVLEQFLRRIGVADEGCVIDDGSGLSHSNRTTAAVQAGVLTYMDRHPRQEEWIATLAEPGADGTIKRRLRELSGRVFAKTGHIKDVSALAGYVFGPDGRRYAFSILCNDTSRSRMSSNALQDAICRKLATWEGPLTTASSQ
ncbi:MAG: D-alanyl-D-alanine carboxypeptidase/D-alanyl-D-alanine-endopeptidase [Planctomycetes bacterium]|nr:D-alanyl-D-alanine carboxypeptidase/D-alanyl-D-alanine-endopeptidase [Planctomycetota bacterium]